MCSLSSSTRSSTRGTSKASNNCGSEASDNCGGKASGKDCNIDTIVAYEKGTVAIATLERALQSVGVSADGVIGLFKLAATIVEVARVVSSARL